MCAAIAAWLRIAHPRGGARPEDARHSGLLRRLLSGERPLPAAPPLADGYPWYQLIDHGEAHPSVVFLAASDRMTIEHHDWEIVEGDKSQRRFLVRWPASGLECRLVKRRLDKKKWLLTLVDQSESLAGEDR